MLASKGRQGLSDFSFAITKVREFPTVSQRAEWDRETVDETGLKYVNLG
jgi:hypothetical protein